MICFDQAHHVMPHVQESRLKEMLPFLNEAMIEAEITDPDVVGCEVPSVRAAAFLAQLACESAEFRYFEEIADGKAYEGRADLGNTHPGDGPRFKGRGPIQITGRANYKAAGDALGLDLVNHPELAAKPEIGFRLAAWFWKSRGLNVIADSICGTNDASERARRFDAVTRKINGGTNGKIVRDLYFARACAALKVFA
jgi:predicted chitinase